jgi:hypothetical protein
MKTNPLLHLSHLKEALQISANEIKAEFPELLLDYMGLEPAKNPIILTM